MINHYFVEGKDINIYLWTVSLSDVLDVREFFDSYDNFALVIKGRMREN